MSNIDKHALNQEKIEWLNKLADMEYCKSNPGHWLMSLKDTNMLAKLALRSVALLDELESKQTFQQAFFRQSLMYDVVAEAYEEAKEQVAKDVEIKSRLCLESNSLFDRLRAAEKRIAELELKLEAADKLQDSAFRHGLQHGFSLGQTDNQAGFEECLSAYGTGKGE